MQMINNKITRVGVKNNHNKLAQENKSKIISPFLTIIIIIILKLKGVVIVIVIVTVIKPLSFNVCNTATYISYF